MNISDFEGASIGFVTTDLEDETLVETFSCFPKSAKLHYPRGDRGRHHAQDFCHAVAFSIEHLRYIPLDYIFSLGGDYYDLGTSNAKISMMIQENEVSIL